MANSATNSDRLVHNSTGGIPRLIEIMRRLRDPQTGCPWDLEQTFASIAPYTIEEAYEVADAIEREAWDELKGELGDLLFQSIFHAQMANERDLFNIDDVANTMSDKMIDRHPHVFGTEKHNKSADQQTIDWETVKAAERAARGTSGVLDDVAVNLPALMRAVKLQNRAARVGFDWPETTMVLDKIVEESQELVEAKMQKSKADVEEEFGDLLFVMANLARHLKIDPESALRAANSKFHRRFRGVEAKLKSAGKSPESSSLEEMDQLWNEVKKEEHTSVS